MLTNVAVDRFTNWINKCRREVVAQYSHNDKVLYITGTKNESA